MIIVNIKGGLGNQMFQYALGRNLALKNNTELKLDTSGLDQAIKVADIYRPLGLNNFNIKNTEATATEIEKIKNPFGFISKLGRKFSAKILRQTNVVFNPKILELSGDIYLDGFWQSPKYFEASREILIKDFTLKSPLSLMSAEFAKQIESGQAVSIHIRRGDYIKNPRVQKEFCPCSLDYYKKALAEIQQQVESPTYFVFSDDIDWARSNLPLGENAVFVKGEGMSDAEELILMSKCKHNIIANSSFSWWAAWLNQNPNKIVIAPTPWFDKVTYDQDLIPSSWTQLPK